MKYSEFTYKKADGKISKRQVVFLASDNPNKAGIDVSELEEDQFSLFVEELKELDRKHWEELKALMAKHDLKNSYRQFKAENMTDVTNTPLI